MVVFVVIVKKYEKIVSKHCNDNVDNKTRIVIVISRIIVFILISETDWHLLI